MSQLVGNESQTGRLIYLAIACVQNMCMGGVFYGWTSISGTLLMSSDGGPGLKINKIQYIYVAASFFNSMGPLCLGIILDSYGPRVCSITSILLIVIGFLLFSFSNEDTFPMFVPAMCLIAFGGPGAQSAIIHLSNLFPKFKATMTAIITGCFQLSFIIFFIFDELWLTFNWSYTQLFQFYSVICLMNLVISVFIWPDKPLNYDEQMMALHPEEMLEDEVQVQKNTLYRLPSVMMHLTKENMLPDLSPSKKKKYGTDAEDLTVGVHENRAANRAQTRREEVAAFFESDLPEDEQLSNLEDALRRKKMPKALELLSFGMSQEMANLAHTGTQDKPNTFFFTRRAHISYSFFCTSVFLFASPVQKRAA